LQQSQKQFKKSSCQRLLNKGWKPIYYMKMM